MGDPTTRLPPAATSSQAACLVFPRQIRRITCCSRSARSSSKDSISSQRLSSCSAFSSLYSEGHTMAAPSLWGGQRKAWRAALCVSAAFGLLAWTVGVPLHAASAFSFAADSGAPPAAGGAPPVEAGEEGAAEAAAAAGGKEGLPCSTLAACRTETEALLLLQQQYAAAAGEQQQPAASKESSPQQQQQQQRGEGLEAFVEMALRRGWWAAAREVILASHRAGVDVSSIVRRTVQEIRDELDESVRLLDKRYHEIQVVPPAFQWAQSPEEIFLNVKFAYRWSSPGALSVSDPTFHSEARHFSFSGVGLHSGVQKKYSLALSLYSDIEPEATKYSFASLGRVVVTLQKKEAAIWERLTKDTAKISNMNVWWDMKEKYQKELDEFRKGGNKTKTSPADAAATASSSETTKANSASSSNSKSSPSPGSKAAAATSEKNNNHATPVAPKKKEEKVKVSGRREEL